MVYQQVHCCRRQYSSGVASSLGGFEVWKERQSDGDFHDCADDIVSHFQRPGVFPSDFHSTPSPVYIRPSSNPILPVMPATRASLPGLLCLAICLLVAMFFAWNPQGWSLLESLLKLVKLTLFFSKHNQRAMQQPPD